MQLDGVLIFSNGNGSRIARMMERLVQRKPGINQMLAQIAAIEPKDGIEAMLATQMVTVHNAMLNSARSLRGSDTITQQDSNGNLVNKLARNRCPSRGVEAL